MEELNTFIVKIYSFILFGENDSRRCQTHFAAGFACQFGMEDVRRLAVTSGLCWLVPPAGGRRRASEPESDSPQSGLRNLYARAQCCCFICPHLRLKLLTRYVERKKKPKRVLPR